MPAPEPIVTAFSDLSAIAARPFAQLFDEPGMGGSLSDAASRSAPEPGMDSVGSALDLLGGLPLIDLLARPVAGGAPGAIALLQDIVAGSAGEASGPTGASLFDAAPASGAFGAMLGGTMTDPYVYGPTLAGAMDDSKMPPVDQ